MFYVYHGYVSPDNYDASESPCYELTKIENDTELDRFKREFEEKLSNDATNIEFIVVEGVERKLVPKETVTHWILAK